MANTWQLQRAKAELSKLIDTSVTKGPQTVARYGRPVAVVVSAAEYQRLAGRQRDFKAFLRRVPLYQLKLARRRDAGRRVTLMSFLLDTCVLSGAAPARSHTQCDPSGSRRKMPQLCL